MDQCETSTIMTESISSESKNPEDKSKYDLKEVLANILDLYKDMPCLWNPKDVLYRNKEARRQAWGRIIPLWSKTDPQGSAGSIKMKLKNMKKTFMQEYKKVEDCITSGAEGLNVYRPKLWYFNHMLFVLSDQIQSSLSEALGEKQFEPIDLLQPLSDKDEPINSNERTTIGIKRPLSDDDITWENLMNAPKNNTLDPCSAFGQYIEPQLNEMTKMQRCIAEKLISEVIYYGKLDKLTLDSSVNLSEVNSHGSRSPSPYTTWLEPS